MVRLNCDYSEGAHINILNKLMETNLVQTPGYGEDVYCDEARDIIKKVCENDNADVHFLVGGTQANMTVIAAALKPYQCVICAKTGHINVHETGAVEATGHKIIGLPSDDGKITAQQIEKEYLYQHNNDSFEHITQPKMVYISNPTELGTIYYKQELEAISKVCRQYNLYLFLDGARLGYGLCAEDNDIKMKDLAELCDVFYIGGTKIGALFGEAVVISNDELKTDFRYMIKQCGGMLAKGRLVGIQFAELLRDGLYFDIAKYADDLAMRIKKAFTQKGYKFLVDSCTNQQFVILPDILLEKMKMDYAFSYERRIDETHSAVRFCTSWATKESDIDEFIKYIKNM